MATLALPVNDIEIESMLTKNSICSLKETETGVAVISDSNEANIMKESLSSDSGILMYKSSSDVSSLIVDEDNEHSTSCTQSTRANVLYEYSSDANEDDEPLQQQRVDQSFLNNKTLQKNKAPSNSTDSKFDTIIKSNEYLNCATHNNKEIQKEEINCIIDSSQIDLINSNNLEFEFSNTQNMTEVQDRSFKNDSKKDKIVGLSFKSMVESQRSVIDKSNDESNSKSSFTSSKTSLSDIDDDNETNYKSSQNVHSECTKDLSNLSTLSRSTKKNSQSDSDDEYINTFSGKSSNKQGSPERKSVYSSDKGSDSKIRDTSPMVDKLDDGKNLESKIKIFENESQGERKKTQLKNYSNIIDSDSDEEVISSYTLKSNHRHDELHTSPKKKSFKSAKKSKINDNLKSVYEKSKIHNDGRNFEFSNDLVDSDSESDNIDHSENDNNDHSENDSGDMDENNYTKKNKKDKLKGEKKHKRSMRASKEIAMQQIHSETQRLIRESQLSLPYHRPKQRTLQEFLNRKKIMSEIPKNLTCAEKVKMFPEIISKVVEEKEKEAEIFYKSSDSEEDETCNEVTKVNDINEKNENKQEIQIKNDSKNEGNIQEKNLQKRSLDLGVSRKLFMEDTNDPGKDGNLNVLKCMDDKERSGSSDSIDLEEKPNEAKIIVKESNIVNTDIGIDNSDKNKMDKKINDAKIKSLESTTSLENSTEEIVLNVSETELNSSEDKGVLVESNIENKGQETAVISESIDASISNKLEDPILRLGKEKVDNDEILDYGILENDFSLPFDLEEDFKESNTKKQILAKALRQNPTIKGSPGSMIDLAVAGQMKEGVTRLLDRFARHSVVVKPKVEEVAEVKILRTEGSGNDIQVIEETLPFKRIIVEDEDNKEQKPGEKLRKLREDLKRRIATVRNEEWRLKEKREKEDDEKTDDAVDDFYANLPDEEELLEEEEEEESSSSSSSSESEPEENDVLVIDKRKRSCQFAEEEAEETDNEYEDDGAIAENEEDEEEEEEEEENQQDEGSELDVRDGNSCSDDDDGGSREGQHNDGPEDERGEKSCLKPRVLKRIVRPFEEESNQSESSLSNDVNSRLSFDRTKTDEDMFASQTSNSNASEDIDGIPPFQPRARSGSDSRSQACKTPLAKPSNILSMISPVAQLTALNASLGSAKRSASKTNSILFGQMESSRSVGSTPAEESDRPKNSCNLEKMISLPKKLFEDTSETVNDDELLDICSGKFTETQNLESGASNKKSEVTDSQLMELCSGAFPTQSIDTKKLESTGSNVHLSDETSQDINLTLEDEENDDATDSIRKMSSSMKRSDESMFSSDSKSPVKVPNYGSAAAKNPMETWLKRANEKAASSQAQLQKRPEVTDSQLMDICSGAFATQPLDMKELEQSQAQKIQSLHDFAPIPANGSKSLNKKSKETKTIENKAKALLKQTITDKEEESLAPWSAYTVMSSDDEDFKEQKKKNAQLKKKGLRRRNKVKKLELSDDEDDKSNEFSEEEEDEPIEDQDHDKYIDYDSDENEIIVNKKEIKKVAAKYLENEAELSESDWDSADEDEQDMDNFDYEEGDKEEIDEHKMKKQLERIHAQKMMDQDQREVKMLQELLFDDGDLHDEAGGRERKFKWKNIDKIGDDELRPSTIDDDEMDDEIDTEIEAQMRKIRYEQNKFLEEKQKKMDEFNQKEFEENNSLKLGLKVVSVRSSNILSLKNTKTKGPLPNGISNLSSNAFINSKSLSFSKMQGSFLSRGNDTLIRIAQNLPETNKKIINSSRNRKFVFENLSPSVSDSLKEDIIEEESDSTPKNKIKSRKRKTFLTQTPKSTKKLKVDDRTSSKKLF